MPWRKMWSSEGRIWLWKVRVCCAKVNVLYVTLNASQWLRLVLEWRNSNGGESGICLLLPHTPSLERKPLCEMWLMFLLGASLTQHDLFLNFSYVLKLVKYKQEVEAVGHQNEKGRQAQVTPASFPPARQDGNWSKKPISLAAILPPSGRPDRSTLPHTLVCWLSEWTGSALRQPLMEERGAGDRTPSRGLRGHCSVSEGCFCNSLIVRWDINTCWGKN